MAARGPFDTRASPRLMVTERLAKRARDVRGTRYIPKGSDIIADGDSDMPYGRGMKADRHKKALA